MTDTTDERIVELSWLDIEERCTTIADQYRPATKSVLDREPTVQRVYGIPRGGLIPAAMIAARLGVPLTDHALGPRTLVVDDVADSGVTLANLFGPGIEGPRTDSMFVALYSKPTTPSWAKPGSKELAGWIVYPWERAENQSGPEDAVRRLLQAIGEDPDREGIKDTPRRVVGALREMTSGMNSDPADHLATTFASGGYDEVVLVDGIRFTSLCEHHLLPFSGVAHVGYKPNEAGRVVGLSKIPRVVEGFARRPQLQEQLTKQIADAMVAALDPAGVAVIIRAQHSCMGCRGVRQPDARMTTSEMRGLFRDDARARAEILALLPHAT